jgi:uncharacterized protein YdaU (DUF1376 family)
MGKAAPAIPLFGDAYIADTRHLSLEEHGAYLQLMMIAWRADDCSLPDDDARIARMLGVTGKKWAKLKPVVMAFWTLENGRWAQKRLSKERRFVAKKSEQNRESANARWNAKPLENNAADDANASPAHSERNAPPPPPSSVDKSTGGKPPDLLKAMFDDGLELLTSTGTPEKQARSLLGKWKKAKGEAEVLVGLADCRAKRIEQPVEWLEKRFKSAAYVSASGYEYRGSIDAVIREAEKRADWNTYWAAKADRERKAA